MRPALLFVALLVAGCGSGGTKPTGSSAARGTKLLDAGGGGKDVTAAFDVKGSGLRIDYRLNAMPPNGRIALTLEKENANGAFETATNANETVPDGLSGSKTMPILPGRYRLRVDVGVVWSGVLYETP